MAESLRSRTFGELFGYTFTVFFKCFGRLLTVQLLFWLPIVFLVAFGAYLLLSSGALDAMGEDGAGPLVVVTGVSSIVLGCAMVVLSPLPNAVSMIIIADHILGERTPLVTAFGVALRKLIGFIIIGLVYALPWILPGALLAIGAVLGPGGGLLMGVGALLLAVATVVTFILVAMLFVAGPALVLERTGAGDAIRRSKDLTSGSRWSVLGLAFLVNFLVGVASSFIVTPLNLANMFLIESEVAQLACSVIGNVLQQVLGGAIGGVLTVVLYFDLRVKKEGFDVESLAALVDVIAEREAAPQASADVTGPAT